MLCIVMHQAYDGFYFILKKHLKLSQNINFLANFERFLVYTFLHPTSYTQSSAKLNVIWRYIIMASFISVTFVVIKF